ncbi:MAG: ABC transporter ATP-binding protein [Propionibacteriales bacterium]|nr:ABC transporter ATP-binding protein [Propionibacteriales bacterium]
MPGAFRHRAEWQFFRSLTGADRRLATFWWAVLFARGILPAVFAITMGALVGAVQGGRTLTAPLVAMGIAFVLMQVLTPLHEALSVILGGRLSAWLNDELATSCVEPPGIGHLEDPELTNDLVTARDFDLGMTGPPMYLNVGFIASGLVEMVSGIAAATVLFGFTWWAPLVLGAAWASTHWLLRESSIWRDRNTDVVRSAQRQAEYAYRLAVDPPPAKELRLFGLQEWVTDRFRALRHDLFDLQYEATRLRQKSVLLSLLIVSMANGLVFWTLGSAAAAGELSLTRLVVYAQLCVGVSAIAFGGFNWALDGAAAPVAAVLRLKPAMAPVGALPSGNRAAAPRAPRSELRIHDLRFRYPGTTRPIFDGLDLTVPARSSLAIVGQNGAGKTTLAKLLCRLYDPDSGGIEVDGTDVRQLDIDVWRSRVTAVFQDFVRFDLSLRDNVAPNGASDEDIVAALRDAGADHLTDLDTPLAKGYPGGTDLSGGQWQRVALARALCAVRLGAGLVLLDEPTAQLDVRGEAAIFDRILDATRDVTTIVISHRFSTVRHADRIAVLEHGRVIELGSHDALIRADGRYRTMFDLQASRFAATTDEEGMDYDVLT